MADSLDIQHKNQADAIAYQLVAQSCGQVMVDAANYSRSLSLVSATISAGALSAILAKKDLWYAIPLVLAQATNVAGTLQFGLTGKVAAGVMKEFA